MRKSSTQIGPRHKISSWLTAVTYLLFCVNNFAMLEKDAFQERNFNGSLKILCGLTSARHASCSLN